MGGRRIFRVAPPTGYWSCAKALGADEAGNLLDFASHPPHPLIHRAEHALGRTCVLNKQRQTAPFDARSLCNVETTGAMKRMGRILRPLLAFICSFSWVIPIAAQINPVNVGHTNNGGNAYGIVVSGNHAYLANGTDGLRIYDVSNSAMPVNVGHTNNGGLAPGGIAYNVAVLGTYAYLANYVDGLRVYDVSDPAKPSNVSHTNLPPWLRSLAFYNNYAYLGGDSVIGIFDITDPAFPVKASQPHVPENPNSMVVLTNVAWLLSASFSGLRVYDISNPTNLVNLGPTNNLRGVQGVAVAGHYAFLAEGTDGVRIYDIF